MPLIMLHQADDRRIDAQPSDAADRFTAGFRPLFRGR